MKNARKMQNRIMNQTGKTTDAVHSTPTVKTPRSAVLPKSMVMRMPLKIWEMMNSDEGRDDISAIKKMLVAYVQVSILVICHHPTPSR